MARTSIPALPWRPVRPRWDWRGRLARVRWWGLLGAAVALIAVARLLAPAALARLDGWLGRDGDSLLLLALLLLAGAAVQGRRAAAAMTMAAPPADGAAAEGAAAALAQHLRLDEEIERRLDVVVADTEQSAAAIIGHVRSLYDQAEAVVQYLDRSSTRTGELGQEITDSVASLLDIGAFLERLPAKFERDVQQTQAMARDIVELGGLADAVQAISMQSHILGINAAIEAGHAGESGRSFRIVAQEMRALAANSSAVATRITKGLTALREGIEDGARTGAAELARELEAVMHSSQAIRQLQDNFEDINQFCKTRFAVLTRHNQVQAANIAEVLGQIQYQDVVRQSIERLQGAARRRNEALCQALPAGAAGPDGAALAEALAGVLDGFLAEEARHSHSAREGGEGDGPKIELF